MRYTDDAALVRAAQRSPAAFGALYERYHPLIIGYARRRTGNRMQAEDVAADTFLRALQALDRYEERGVPFSAWLFRIATNQLTEQGRRGHGIAFQPLEGGQAYDGGSTAGAGQEEQLDRRERLAGLCAELRRLSADQQRAIWLRFWQGYSVREMAARLRRSEGATKTLLHRALKSLRAQLLICS